MSFIVNKLGVLVSFRTAGGLFVSLYHLALHHLDLKLVSVGNFTDKYLVVDDVLIYTFSCVEYET